MIFVPPEWIKENLLTPAGLSEDLIAQLTPDRMAGARHDLPLYDKYKVEEFVKRKRPASPVRESVQLVEGLHVVESGTEEKSFERIANCLEQLVAVLVPRVEPKRVEASERAYTTAEAAVLLKRHPDVVRQYCRAGVLGCRDASGKWVIRHSEIERFRTGQVTVYGEGVA